MRRNSVVALLVALSVSCDGAVDTPEPDVTNETGPEIPYEENIGCTNVVADPTCLDGGTSMTLESWVKVAAFPNGVMGPWDAVDTLPIFSQGHATSTAGNYTFGVSPEGVTFVFETLDSRLLASAPILPGDWVHVAVVHTFGCPDLTRVYVDGNRVESCRWVDDVGQPIDGADLGQPNSGSPYAIGTYGSFERDGYYFDGLIDELRVWRGRRTQGEIWENMDYPITASPPDLVGYWRFNEAASSGDTSADSSGQNNHATLMNDAKVVFGDAPFDASAPENGALSLDGLSNYAHVGYDPSLDITPH